LSSDQTYSSQPIKNFQTTTNVASKLDFDFGKKVAESIYSTIFGNQTYFWIRNNRFRKNRQIATGKIDMSVYLDRLEMNGKNNYVNINWKPILIGNTIISRLVGQWMTRSEKIKITAVDPMSIREKKEQAEEAEYYFQNKDVLNQISQESGVPMIPQGQFVAEDKDELDRWVIEFNNLPEEIKFSLGCNNILNANGWYGVLKEKVLHDSATTGLVATYTWMDEDGEIHVEWVRPENCFYSYSDYPDFRDTSYRGQIKSIKISELRARYGKQFGGTLTEEDIFQIASLSKDYQLTDKIKWMQDWNVSYLRPYDEYNIDIMCFELKSFDGQGYLITKTKKNNNTIIRKSEKPEKIDENQEYIEEKKWNIYEGVYCPAVKKMIKWNIKTNMIRPQDPKEIGNVEFSYSFYMYQQQDMRNVAIAEKIEEPMEQMILARLKIQQLVAKMVPSGAAIDVDSMQELDLGLGDFSKPLDIQKIWEQTGKLYYRGRDAEGNRIPVPITELANSGFAPQMQALIQLYQFHYQVLKDELGDDPNLLQQAATPRVAVQNIESSKQLSSNATGYVYDAFLFLMEDTSRKISCLLNTSVLHSGMAYRNMFSEEDVKQRNFLAKVEMLPTQFEIDKLEAMMNNAIASTPLLTVYLDPFKIMRIAKENVQLAEMYFRQGQKRFIKSEQQKAQQNAQMNNEANQQSIQLKAQADESVEKKKSESKQKEMVIQGLFDLAKVNIPIPEELKPVVASVLKNFYVPVELENQQIEQEIMQQQQQQEMEQESENQPQQQEQPQEMAQQ
jgi:hypothetical protein